MSVLGQKSTERGFACFLLFYTPFCNIHLLNSGVPFKASQKLKQWFKKISMNLEFSFSTGENLLRIVPRIRRDA